MPASWSGTWIFSWTWMLSCDHSAQSPAFPLNKVSWSSPDNHKRLVYMVGSGPHHHGLGKCACRGPPAWYTTGGSRVAQVASHQQGPIINHPYEAFEVAGIINIQQGQGVWHAMLLLPTSSLGASQRHEAQYFVGHDEPLIYASLLLHLVKYEK